MPTKVIGPRRSIAIELLLFLAYSFFSASWMAAFVVGNTTSVSATSPSRHLSALSKRAVSVTSIRAPPFYRSSCSFWVISR